MVYLIDLQYVHLSIPHYMFVTFSALWISHSFAFIPLTLTDFYSHLTRLSSPETNRGLCDLSKISPSAALCLNIHSLELSVLLLSCCSLGTVRELFRELECRRSAQLLEKRGEKGCIRGFFLRWDHEWWHSQSGSWVCGRRAPNLLLPTHTETHTPTHL